MVLFFRWSPVKLMGALMAVLVVLTLGGCAATSTTVVDEEVVTNQKPMSSYKSLIIRDFELPKDLLGDVPENRMGDRDRAYSRMPSELSQSIERYVKSRRGFHTVARAGQPSAGTLVLSGSFTRVGRFRISITGTLHDGASNQEVAYFRQTLWDVVDTTAMINLLGRETADFIDRIQYK